MGRGSYCSRSSCLRVTAYSELTTQTSEDTDMVVDLEVGEASAGALLVQVDGLHDGFEQRPSLVRGCVGGGDHGADRHLVGGLVQHPAVSVHVAGADFRKLRPCVGQVVGG